jgi:diphosphomevalonate decarboxylase
MKASAVAHPNIALIKYWGDRNAALHLPANGSISMNLAGLETRTRVEFDPARTADEFVWQGENRTGPAAQRVYSHLDLIRRLAGVRWKARVESVNNFPAGAGIASSASAFAALTLAAAAALGLKLTDRQLSALARRGSGSACRSVPAGFTEWRMGTGDGDSYAVPIAPPDHWALVDWIAIVAAGEKKTPSVEGHKLARTSPLQAARVADAPRRLALCRKALRTRDFAKLADILEEDARLMHAVMLTSRPALIYLAPETLGLMRAIPAWRADGLPAAFTIDAGPNVHCLCPVEAAPEVERRLRAQPGVRQLIAALPGGAARVTASGPESPQ